MNSQLFNCLIANAAQDQVMLAFHGSFSHAMHDSLLEIAEQRIAKLACGKSVRKRAFHLLIECLQNLYRHADRMPSTDENAEGILLLSVTDEGIRISTGNSVSQKQANDLEQRLNALLQEDQSTLRKTYKERLVNGKMSDLGGAGLGFIDIARKSGRNLDYHFAQLDDERMFFSLNVKVARDGRHTH